MAVVPLTATGGRAHQGHVHCHLAARSLLDGLGSHGHLLREETPRHTCPQPFHRVNRTGHPSAAPCVGGSPTCPLPVALLLLPRPRCSPSRFPAEAVPEGHQAALQARGGPARGHLPLRPRVHSPDAHGCVPQRAGVTLGPGRWRIHLPDPRIQAQSPFTGNSGPFCWGFIQAPGDPSPPLLGLRCQSSGLPFRRHTGWHRTEPGDRTPRFIRRAGPGAVRCSDL